MSNKTYWDIFSDAVKKQSATENTPTTNENPDNRYIAPEQVKETADCVSGEVECREAFETWRRNQEPAVLRFETSWQTIERAFADAWNRTPAKPDAGCIKCGHAFDGHFSNCCYAEQKPEVVDDGSSEHDGTNHYFDPKPGLVGEQTFEQWFRWKLGDRHAEMGSSIKMWMEVAWNGANYNNRTPTPLSGAEREKAVDELQGACDAVIKRWDSPSWKDLPATADYIHRLRKALEAMKEGA